MEKKYKTFAITSLYGLWEFSGETLEKHIKNNFLRFFDKQPENITLQIENSIYTSNYCPVLRLSLTVDGETFVSERDFGREDMVDRRHPKYEDLWFHESEECDSYLTCKFLLEQL